MRQDPALHGLARARWRQADLRRVLPWLRDYSPGGVSRALRRLRISRQRGGPRLHSPDLAYVPKLRWLDHARTPALLPARRATLLYADEVTFYRQPTLAQAYAPRGEAPRAPLALGANTRYRVAAALDWATGRLTYLAHSRLGVYQLKRFLHRLRRASPDRHLALAWDNWPVHHHEAVLAEAAALDLGLLWLPTYAPWTNPVEKVWRWLRQDLLHHHRLADRWPELRLRVRRWLDQFARDAPDLLHYVGELPDHHP